MREKGGHLMGGELLDTPALDWTDNDWTDVIISTFQINSHTCTKWVYGSVILPKV